jgi:hypothetical protein
LVPNIRLGWKRFSEKTHQLITARLSNSVLVLDPDELILYTFFVKRELSTIFLGLGYKTFKVLIDVVD